MKRKIIDTGDGSHSIFVEGLEESYHSAFGAVTESMHVFIHAGLMQIRKDPVHILEAGFGTGLNAFLSLELSIREKRLIHYTAIEKYPLVKEEWEKLNYSRFVTGVPAGALEGLHSCEWETWQEIGDCFRLFKTRQDIRDFHAGTGFDLVYFDAFAPGIQPELWSPEVFSRLHSVMNEGGMLVTYSVKGQVRRDLAAAGFRIEKLPGAAGKRHMLRAVK